MGQAPRAAGTALRALSAAALVAVLGAAPYASAQVRLVSSAPKAPEAPARPAYVDRVIEGLAPEPVEPDASAQYDPAGWPRFLRLETRLGTRPFENDNRAYGFQVTAGLETPSHGTFSLDAALDPEERRQTFTLRQRGLPMDGGWLVNNELGVSTPLAPAIQRLPSRVFLPSVVTRGGATEWLNAGAKVQLLATAGDYGRLSGYPVAGFETLAGTVATLGGQAGFGDWTVAARHARADGLSLSEPAVSTALVDSDSTMLSIRRQWGTASVQANALVSRDRDAPERRGFWLDADWRGGGMSHGAGLYRLDPSLSFAGQPMASDIEGAFARGSWSTRQWSAEGSVDLLRSVTGGGSPGLLVSGSGRWRYSRLITFGGGGSFRHFNGDAGSLFADARWQNDWGSSGLRAEHSDGFGQRTSRLAVDHAWSLPLGFQLSTSLSVGRESGDEATGTLRGGSVSFSAPVSSGLTLFGNATTETRGDGSRASSANVSLAWQVAPRWTLEGNFVYSDGKIREPIIVDPLAPPPERIVTATNTKSAYLVLRYEDQAGSRTVPLGGTPQEGGGRLEGVVFLDANRNGEQEAGEQGASGVTVYLDGKYAARTDSQGRFEFPFVAPGTRTITVLNETLPLPWVSGEKGESKVTVRVRETARLLVPVTRRGPD